MSGARAAADDDGLNDLVAAADEAARELPSYDDVMRKAAQAAAMVRQTMGPLTPVDSGVKMNPRLRVAHANADAVPPKKP